MKFFWKIFFTVMFITLSSVSLSGYILVHSNFNSLLNGEVELTYNLGDNVYYSIATELNYRAENAIEQKHLDIAEIAQTINMTNSEGKIKFAIINSGSEKIFSSLGAEFDLDLISDLSDNQRGFTIRETPDGLYIQSIRPVDFFGEKFYIETVRDATSIFENQTEQYIVLFRIIVGIFVFSGLSAYVISRILMGQIKRLTRVTKDIADGNLDNRVLIKGDDELTVLSVHFNQMADVLEEKICQLQRESDIKELFVGAFSHELKTPLTSIIGYSDMIRSKNMDEERVRLCANYIFTEGKRLEALSMRLLEIIVMRKKTINYSQVLTRTLFDEIKAVMYPELKGLGIVVYMDIEPAIVSLEPELIKTVFINLMDNAKKAIDAGGVIEVRGAKQGERYIVTIKDNGRGMAEEDIAKIKEAFYMVDKSRSKSQGGVGLGLSISDEILKLHGFHMLFKSELNIGTTVSVVIEGVKNEECN